jgi:tRNA(adenine34) deaminase
MPLRALILPPSSQALFAVERLGPIFGERGVRIVHLRGGDLRGEAERLGLALGDCAVLATTPSAVRAASKMGLTSVALYRTGEGADFERAGARRVYRDLPAMVEDLDDLTRALAPHEVTLEDEQLRAWMDEALREAREGAQDGEVPIGSVLACGDGSIVGRGHNRARYRQLGTAHAEMEAFRDAEQRGLRGRGDLILVTTLEPCLMCFGAALSARVDTIVYALEAPPNGALGRVAEFPEGAKRPRLLKGVRRAESLALLSDHARENPGGFTEKLVDSVGG